MLQLPISESSGVVDLATPLRKYLKKQVTKGQSMWGRVFGKGGGRSSQSDSDQERALDSFDDLRKRALTTGGDETATLKNLAKYYEQLCNAESRFPVGKKSAGINLQFRWKPAFARGRKDKKATFYGLFEEKIVVLFNIGAMHTVVAASIDRSDTAGHQSVARHYRIAAGVFEAVRKAISEHDDKAVTSALHKVGDIRSEVLEMCESVCLACAQSCFYEKAAAAKMSPKTLAQLAMGCYKSFESAVSKAEDAKLGEWKTRIEIQRHRFEGAGHYWQSLLEHAKADEVGSGYGVEVARLGEAMNILQLAEDCASSGGDWDDKETVMESVEKLTKIVKQRFDDARDTNNGVYFDAVPEADELDAIDAKILAKSIPFDILNDLDNKHNEDLFRSIVPPVVTEAAVEFASMLDKLVEESKATVRENNDVAKGTLASLGLPAALEAEVTGDSGLSRSILAQIRAARMQSGGIRGLEGKLMGADRAVETATNALSRARDALESEAAEDSRYRREFAGEWNRSRSDSVASSYRTDLAKYASKVKGAKMANVRIRDRLRSSRASLDLLEKSESQLNAMLPRRDDSPSRGGGAASAERIALQRLLLDVSRMLEERNKALKEITDAARDVNIVQIMTKQGALKPTESGSVVIRDKDTLFSTELSKFDEWTAVIKESASSQGALIERVVNTNESYQKCH
eukprot:g5462.t1